MVAFRIDSGQLRFAMMRNLDWYPTRFKSWSLATASDGKNVTLAGGGSSLLPYRKPTPLRFHLSPFPQKRLILRLITFRRVLASTNSHDQKKDRRKETTTATGWAPIIPLDRRGGELILTTAAILVNFSFNTFETNRP